MMKKKILSAVLALCVVATLLPTTALAVARYGQSVLYNVPTVTAAAYAVGAGPTDYEVIGTAITIKTDKGMAWLTQQNESGYWDASYTITLADNIIVSAFLWSPIGTYIGASEIPFDGTFDGDGHTVSGVYLYNSDYIQGLFGYNTGTIKNVGVVNSVIGGDRNVGAIVGFNFGGTVINCWNSGAVSGTHCGGIVGSNQSAGGKIYNCWNSGTVSGTVGGEGIGGIVGSNFSSDIYNSYNTGAINGKNNVGGIVGYSKYGKIYNSYNTGTVTSTNNTTGIYIGGVIGKLSGTSNVRCCYYLAGCATDGQSKVQTGIGTDIINTAGTDADGTTNAFTGTGASCVLSNPADYTITNSANASGKSIAAGASLVTALNTWVASVTYNTWSATADYPTFGALYTTYTLAIADGGTGATGSGSYTSGTSVPISAGTKAGFNFNGWTSGSGSFGNASLASTTFTMPAGSVTITANWTAKTAVSITETAQTFAYDGAAKAFTISGTPSDLYTVTYKQGTADVVDPTNAGNYDVVITRTEDATYASYSRTITAGLVISALSQAEPTVGKTDETVSGAHDGTITGVDNTMEYKLYGAASYTEITGAATSVTGLVPGTYLVRYKAKANYNAGTDASVTIAAGAATYTMSASSLMAFASQAVGYGTVPVAQTVTITNTGSEEITLTQPTSTNYAIGTLSRTILSAGGTATCTATFTVQPITGLAVGTFNETINITGTNSSTTSVSVQFAVTAAAATGGGGASTPPANNDADITVDGNSQTAGTSSHSTDENGKTVTTVTLDGDKFKTIMNSTANGATIIIPVAGGSDAAAGALTGQMVKDMEAKDATLVISTDAATYTIPAMEIDIDAVSAQLGQSVALTDIKVQVRISKPSDDTVSVVADAAIAGGFSLVVPAVEFTISCTYRGTTVAVSAFNAYVERMIAIPDGVDPSKITTGIVVAPDGTTHPVPTKILMIDGKYYAVINSLSNSTYMVIWNPVTFADVTNHWAQTSINNMGARMILSGTGNNNFEPNREITRAEVAAVVVSALGLAQGIGDITFSDVAKTAWYCGYIETAVSYGIITGYDDGRFGPNDQITREQAMTMIARAMKLTKLTPQITDDSINALLGRFSDSEKVSDYANKSVAQCISAGIILGKLDGTIAPKAFITRAEVAVSVERLLQKSSLIS